MVKDLTRAWQAQSHHSVSGQMLIGQHCPLSIQYWLVRLLKMSTQLSSLTKPWPLQVGPSLMALIIQFAVFTEAYLLSTPLLHTNTVCR